MKDGTQEGSARELALFAEIASTGGPAERLQEIIDRRSPLADVPVEARGEASVVRGCATPVWITLSAVGGAVRIAASAGSPLVAGLVRLVCETYDGGSVDDARTRPLLLLELLGLDRRLTPTRLRAVALVRARIAELAGGGDA